MRKWIAGFIIGAIFGFVLMFCIMKFAYAPIYQGKITLNDTQYSAFKEAIVQKDVTVDNINVLNSNEPIVVIFKIRTKGVFPFGHKTMNPEYVVIPLCTILFGGIGSLIGMLFDSHYQVY
jgi:hypothetical protein